VFTSRCYQSRFTTHNLNWQIGFKLARSGFDPSGQELFSSPFPSEPSSCTVGTGSVFRGKRVRDVARPPTPSCTEVLRMNRGIPLLHLCIFIACYGVTFTFNLIKILSFCRTFRLQFVVKENVKGVKMAKLRNLRLP